MNMFRQSWQSKIWEILSATVNLGSAQKISESFSLIAGENNRRVIFSEKLGLAISIKDGGYIPRSGLLVAEELQRLAIKGRVLDIGTGEAGILANCLLALGASEVIATDIDPEAIRWARNASNLSPLISWNHCDLYDRQAGQENGFDLIVSNPPQMPMPYQGHPHDYGGLDGRNIIIRIMQEATTLLKPSGKLILLCFDFLAVEKSLGNQPSIAEIAQGLGFGLRVLSKHDRPIRKGGKTEESISWIQTVYPKYSFLQDDQGNYSHKIFIVEMNRST